MLEQKVTSEALAPETPEVVIGNHTGKYTASNPAIRWLTQRWVSRLDGILEQVAADDRAHDRAGGHALEVGCGEGVIATELARHRPAVTALDLPDAGLRAEWAARTEPGGPRFLHADAHRLPFGDDRFDVVVAVEVLEHLTHPEQALRELARVGRRHLVLSVPREPIFRGCNLLAGRYVRDLGNTPGHVNHWSSQGFRAFVGSVAHVRAATHPFPWTVVWATLPGPAAGATGRPRDRSGRHGVGVGH